MNGTLPYAVPILRALNEILTAAVAMTAFSFILFSLQFLKRRQRLAWAFMPLLLCVAVLYSADALESTTVSAQTRLCWQKLHWTGFILLPAAFFEFSAVVLQTTGATHGLSGGKFRILALAGSSLFLWTLWDNRLFDGIRRIPNVGTTMVPRPVTAVFWGFFNLLLILSFIMLGMAFFRAKTRSGRRRMTYLIAGSAGVIVGTFPLLLFGSGMILSRYVPLFWLSSVIANAAVEGLLLLLGYAVTVFSVPWSDRVTRQRMFEWLMRGPGTAIVTMGAVILVNRGSGLLGLNINGLSSMVMVLSVICVEYLISFLLPHMERTSLVGYGKEDYAVYNQISEMMVFKPELASFLDAVTGALCDRFQCGDGFAAVWDENGRIDPLIRSGNPPRGDDLSDLPALPALLESAAYALTEWNGYLVVPIVQEHEGSLLLLGVFGLRGVLPTELSNAEKDSVEDAESRVRGVLWQRRYLMSAYRALRQNDDADETASFRKGNVLNRGALLTAETDADPVDVSAWVRDALTHYWGGPRLSENPLLRFRIVREESESGDGNTLNALRSVLRQALERIRPEGERSFTAEWTLYNIIDLKYIEKQKVKDVARRLSISEADLYRKQKVALEALAKAILSMESEGAEPVGDVPPSALSILSRDEETQES